MSGTWAAPLILNLPHEGEDDEHDEDPNENGEGVADGGEDEEGASGEFCYWVSKMDEPEEEAHEEPGLALVVIPLSEVKESSWSWGTRMSPQLQSKDAF